MALREKKKRIFDIIQIGSREDWPSRIFDIGLIIMILLNLFIAIYSTFESSRPYESFLNHVELITVIAFTIEYILRLWTAEYLYPSSGPVAAAVRYMVSFNGIIELCSFVFFYLPFFFPEGVVAFRIFRVVRIFRLFRINAYYDALNVISDVIKGKRDQLVSSIFIILVLMTSASLCMYSIEHTAQPEVFRNAFSGFWWAVSTLLTVGYGDIYPVTLAGRIFGMILTFLGVGMVAIPTGILSAGFVEQYTRMKGTDNSSSKKGINFLPLTVGEDHPWRDMKVADLPLPAGLRAAAVQRGNKLLIPDEATKLRPGDTVLLYTNEETGTVSV